MDLFSVVYLISTLSTVSFFNLRILRKISEIKSAYEASHDDFLLRLGAVEYGLTQLQGSVSSTIPSVDSRVDGQTQIG
jgi:hypothetical protein